MDPCVSANGALRIIDQLGVTRLAAKSSGFTCPVLDLQQSLMVNGFGPPVCKIFIDLRRKGLKYLIKGYNGL